MRHAGLAILLACACSRLLAVDTPSTARMPLDFELSDGRTFVALSALPPMPTVVNFWRADCPPCVREMPELASLARLGKVRVITIAVQRPAETAAAPDSIQQALRPPVLSLHGPSEPRGLLARFGNRIGALPHTVVLNPQRLACTQHSGEINRQWLENAIIDCQRT